MSTPKRIWHVLLDSPAGSDNDSKRFVRTCVFEGNSNVSLTASALCRKVVESSGEWLLKICKRHPAARDNGAAKACILLNYGCGYATLVLMNGAELDSSDQWKLNPISINVVVASVKSEKSGKTSDARIREYGTVSADDAIYDHLAEFQSECKEGVRIYLHPSLEGGPALEGAFDTDYATNQGDRKHVFRVWSDPGDPLAMSRLERTVALEKQLREGSLHLRPAKKARTNIDVGDSTKKVQSQKTTAPASPTVGKASVAVAKGAKKSATTPKASTASAKPDKHTTKKSTAKASTTASPDENPGDGAMAKKPGPKPKTAEKVKEGGVFQNVASVASKVMWSDSKDDTAMKDAVSDQSKKEAPETKDDGDDDESKKSSDSEMKDKGDDQSKKNKLGFHPREIVLLHKAFEDTLDEDDLKKKVSYKNGHDAYTEKETKTARRILHSIDKEVEEMRNPTNIEKSVNKHYNHPAVEGSEAQTVAKVPSKKSPAKPKATTKASKGATMDAKDEADKKKEAAETLKKVAAANKQDEKSAAESPFKLLPPASKSRASSKKPDATATTEPDKKDDKPPEKRKPGRPKGSENKVPEESKKESTKATAKASKGAAVDSEDESTKRKEVAETQKQMPANKQDEKSSAKSPSKPPSSTTASPKKPDATTTTEADKKDTIYTVADEDLLLPPPERRKPGRPKGSKNKVKKESKKESKSSKKKKSSKRKRELDDD